MSRTTTSSSCRCLSSMSSVSIKFRCANELIVCRRTSAIGVFDVSDGSGCRVVDRQRAQASDGGDPGGDIAAGKAVDDRDVEPAFPLRQCLLLDRQ